MASTWPSKFFGKWKFRLRLSLPKEKNHKPYIVPTKFGTMYGLLCLSLLYISFASGNNLMYLYTFFLSGIGFSSLWFTNANISDLSIEDVEVDDIFAGDKAYATVTIKNRSHIPRSYIEVQHKNVSVVIEGIPPLTSRSVRICLGEFSRGRHPVPRLTLASQFPFLLLRTWKNIKLNKSFAVFPQRKGQTQLPNLSRARENVEGQAVALVRSPESEFTGHRKFESNDSPRHIDWKAYARTERLLVKDYQSYLPQEVKIQWHQTTHLENFEDRLSQMAMWIEIAEMKGLQYSFEFGPLVILSGRGRPHYLQCLKHLAEAEQGNLT